MNDTSTVAVKPPGDAKRFFGTFSMRSWRGSTLTIVLAAIWLFFYFSTDGTFLTQRNLILLALQSSIVALAAISAVMLIVTRNFDLSVGSAVALVGVIVAVLTVKFDVNPALAVVISLAAGLVMGAWQGWWVTRMGVSSFIVTLAGHVVFSRHLNDHNKRRNRGAAATRVEATRNRLSSYGLGDCLDPVLCSRTHRFSSF